MTVSGSDFSETMKFEEGKKDKKDISKENQLQLAEPGSFYSWPKPKGDLIQSSNCNFSVQCMDVRRFRHFCRLSFLILPPFSLQTYWQNRETDQR